jgi:RNA polymerase sigma factor (sigma-70 family)
MNDLVLSTALARLREARDDDVAWLTLYGGLRIAIASHVRREIEFISPSAVEDVVQEVFVRLAMYCPFADLRDTATFRAYVRTVTANVCRDYRRREKRHQQSSEIEGVEGIVTNEGTEGEAALEAAILTLEDRDRQLLALKLEGFSAAEIARRLGLTVSNVYVRLHRVRKVLAKAVK